MFRVVNIGDKEVPMKATASSDLRFKQIFRVDPYRLIQAKDYSEANIIDFFQKMGFVMAMAAEKSPQEMAKLTEDDFEAWFDQFNRREFISAIDAISAVYYGQTETEASPKNA